MLKYRSLKFFSDAWLHLLTAICTAADRIHTLEQQALNYSNTLDQKAIEAAQEAHGKALDAAHEALGTFHSIVDNAEEEGKRLIAKAEADAALLVSRARTVREDAIDTYSATVKAAHAFLDKAFDHHA